MKPALEEKLINLPISNEEYSVFCQALITREKRVEHIINSSSDEELIDDYQRELQVIRSLRKQKYQSWLGE